MQYTTMEVQLGNDQGLSTVLKYQIRDTQAAQIWAQCIAQDASNGFREDDRFYNFPNHKKSELIALCLNLETVREQLQYLHQDLEFPVLDQNRLQESINTLHYHFAHGHHVQKYIHEGNQSLWSQFNILLHEIEFCMMSQKSVERTTLPLANIIFTVNEIKRIPIPDQSYSDFTVGVTFGEVYVNYCQVGRTFLEMYEAQDDQLDDQHIQPFQFISADTSLWFGPTRGAESDMEKLRQVQVWFQQRESRFNSLGFHWGDPKLALGRLPVAQLQEPLFTVVEMKDFIERISKFNKVIGVVVR